MIKKTVSDKNITIGVLMFFALALLLVGAVLRTRMGMFIQSYTENQVGKQAETHALLMEEKLNTELDDLEYIADRLGASLDNMEDLMPRIYDKSGIKQGLLSIDGEALYGEKLDVSVFDGIQSSFRGNKVITFVENQGLLFTCPVFNGPNIRYVLYRLYPMDTLSERFATEIYDDLGKFCVTTRDSQVIIPFYGSLKEEMEWFESESIQSKYESMHLEMQVSVAVARTFSTERGDVVLFESEIPGTDYLVSGYVPKSVAAEGIENLTLLVVWVFGLLMLLVMIGAFYLTRVSIKVRESDELREAKAVAEEASRAKSDFLANMSHEIRTPINAVLGMNEMILRESSDDVITTYASNIKSAGNSLLGIINDILDFSKIEAGKIEIISAEYSLLSVINDLVNMIRNRVDDKGLRLFLDFDPGLPKGLIGDEVRIKQVITNLLSNAVKYTEKGSITFGIKFEETGDDDGSIMLRIYVKDTGIGIKPEEIDKLFAEFERIEEKRNRNIEGTGLGMSITRNLLEMMGSTLNVESVYGEGSVFSFTLKQRVADRQPIGDYEATLSQQLMAREKHRERFFAPGARVLVVDDNEMNLMVFGSLIKQTRVKTDSAQSGDEGIALSEKTKYDMIFLDHMMPEKDGIETMCEIRGNAANPNVDTPMICLTANAISGARDEYIEAGFDDYLTKPIDTDKLEDIMLKYLPEELIDKYSAVNEDPGDETGSDIPDELRALTGSMIDVKAGMKNSGDKGAYLGLLKIFYESIDEKTEELNCFFGENDLKNYTIKVHALKSSARIIGAADFGEEAQRLEEAGKAGNTDYIHSHHEGFIKEYAQFKALLSAVFPEDASDTDKPEADEELMSAVFEEIKEAAEDMSCERLDIIFEEMEDYRIPDNYKDLFKKLIDATAEYDYKKVLELMG